jgi:hypothetical protein
MEILYLVADLFGVYPAIYHRTAKLIFGIPHTLVMAAHAGYSVYY